MTTFLIVPGYGNSGPDHWQSHWQREDTRFRRVEQSDRMNSVCDDWVASLEKAVDVAGPDSVLVAHSLGCSLVAHWAERSRRRVRAALLVAPPDPQGPAAELNIQGFAPLPKRVLPFTSMVLASSDDPYASLEYTRTVAECWRSAWRNLGAFGHINGESGLGSWPQGRELLQSLLL